MTEGKIEKKREEEGDREHDLSSVTSMETEPGQYLGTRTQALESSLAAFLGALV